MKKASCYTKSQTDPKPIRLVYIAGPYRAETVAGIHRNIETARAVAEDVWRLGYVAVCPHLNSAYMDGVVSDRDFLAGGIEILKRCDAVLLCYGWQRSSGTLAEIEVAQKRGMPIFEDVRDIVAGIAIPREDIELMKATAQE